MYCTAPRTMASLLCVAEVRPCTPDTCKWLARYRLLLDSPILGYPRELLIGHRPICIQHHPEPSAVVQSKQNKAKEATAVESREKE